MLISGYFHLTMGWLTATLLQECLVMKRFRRGGQPAQHAQSAKTQPASPDGGSDPPQGGNRFKENGIADS